MKNKIYLVIMFVLFCLIMAVFIPKFDKHKPVPVPPIMEVDSTKVDSSIIIIEIATNADNK